ncbi:DoxX family protein [Mycobacterium sp. CPCC 205372]|uniref:DoxX family protein n=1 Tax=Mycobacterium hippophais TaxID=3016340 RepID=A0ABT4PTT3_9MYCO|nr:DoxX family protein [Mycobacterium hippophais]MCZ8379936.1 DoxX family protein [Mycobacterium hippophais]
MNKIDGRPGDGAWSPITRVAFRFVFVYLSLFCLLFAQITFVFTGIVSRWLPDWAVMWQLMALEAPTRWVAHTVFGVDVVLHRDSGSGDQAVIWVLVFSLFAVSLLATSVWTAVDRRRTGYPRLWSWLLLFLRLCLGGQMLFYGFAKLIPTQMPAPPLAALLRPFGELSPASVLWLQVGSSFPYEILLGSAEVIGGVLLFWSRTATLGALVSVMSMAQVFVLNMTFDVPVKILSFHLLVIGLVILAPQFGRLADMLILERQAAPAVQPPLFDTPRANRIAAAVVAVLGVWVLAGCVAIGVQSWYEYGGGRQKPDLYGIWSVTGFEVDGKEAPALLGDEIRWQRVVVDEPGALTYQRMNGELVSVPAEVDADGREVRMPSIEARFTVGRPSPEALRFEGTMDGRRVEMSLRRVDVEALPLNSRGFQWVQEYPYFR